MLTGFVVLRHSVQVKLTDRTASTAFVHRYTVELFVSAQQKHRFSSPDFRGHSQCTGHLKVGGNSYRSVARETTCTNYLQFTIYPLPLIESV